MLIDRNISRQISQRIPRRILSQDIIFMAEIMKHHFEYVLANNNEQPQYPYVHLSTQLPLSTFIRPLHKIVSQGQMSFWNGLALCTFDLLIQRDVHNSSANADTQHLLIIIQKRATVWQRLHRYVVNDTIIHLLVNSLESIQPSKCTLAEAQQSKVGEKQ